MRIWRDDAEALTTALCAIAVLMGWLLCEAARTQQA